MNPRDRLTDLFGSLMRKFFVIVRRELAKEGLSVSQLYVLKTLGDCCRVQMGDARNVLNVSAAVVTGLVDKLVKKGFVVRDRSSNDRRVITISLTGKGKNFLRKMEKKKKAFYDILLEGLDEKEQEAIIKGFSRLNERLELFNLSG